MKQYWDSIKIADGKLVVNGDPRNVLLGKVSEEELEQYQQRLEQEGIVYLEPLSPKNKNVCLTEAGKQLTQQTAGRLHEMENAVFASWPPEDVEKYIALTEAYLHALREQAALLQLPKKQNTGQHADNSL